jgi:hypothetical protein
MVPKIGLRVEPCIVPEPTFDASWFRFAAMSVFFKTQNWEPGINKASQVNGVA